MNQTEQLYIPERLNVGFQKRDDTYTGQLAYVIYYDHKGTLRKEKSWQSWRAKNITPKEYENKPTEGFVLNRHGGGGRHSYGWNPRNEFIRVWDPRNFEFEISLANLLFILKECDCSRGKGLEGKFVYAWDRDTLVLLPATSEEYKKCAEFTKLQAKSVSVKELVPGYTYLTKKQVPKLYIGKFDYHYLSHRGENAPKVEAKGVEKRFVFTDPEGKNFEYLTDPKGIAALQSDVVSEKFADLVQRYNKSPHGSRAVRLFLKDVPDKSEDNRDYHLSDCWYEEESPGVFVEYGNSYSGYGGNRSIYATSRQGRVSIEDDVLIHQNDRGVSYADGRNPHRYYGGGTEVTFPWKKPTTARLFVELENGSKVRYYSYNFKR